MTHRIPNKVNSFEGFRKKKSCKVKDCAVKIVTKMCHLHCINMRELQEEVDNKRKQMMKMKKVKRRKK